MNPPATAVDRALSLVRSRQIRAGQAPAIDFYPTGRSSPARLQPAREPAQGWIGRAGDLLRSGKISCVELLEDCLKRIEVSDSNYRAFVCLNERARSQALALDNELAQEQPRGPLHGIPISIKDIVDVAGMPTRAGSDAYLTRPLAHAEAVRMLVDAGCVVIGKTSAHEFALGMITPQSRNPHDPRRSPGGSSGGSAIAVAQKMGLGSVGSDTRGSIRIPASLTGVVGFKPTFGRVSVEGVLPLSWSMDHVGPLTRSVADASVMLDTMAGPGFCEFSGSDVSQLRVGAPEAGCEGADPEVESRFAEAVATVARLTGRVGEAKRPSVLDFSNAFAASLIVSRCEAAAYHRRLGLDRSKYWKQTLEQLEAADGISAVDYLDAQRLRAVLGAAMLQAFEDFDVLVMPTTLTTAPIIEEAAGLTWEVSRNVIPWSFIGFPAVSVPCGKTASGLPVGIQLVAPPLEEGSLVALGAAFEAAL
ncbi:MAG: amidase [Actinomycetota bacterium]